MPRHPDRLRCRLAWAGAMALTASMVAGASAGAARADDEADARASVEATIDEVMRILHDDVMTLENKKDHVEAIAIENFDFDVISRLVLARNWRKFNDTQRADFAEAFKHHLSATYRDTLDNFSDETITVESSRSERNGDVTVKTVVHVQGDKVLVDYRMRKREDRWLGIDVIIEGVSLVQNFRAQAQEIVTSEGPDALIQRLRDKNTAEAG